MSTLGWVLVGVAVWVGAAVLVGWGLGRMLRRRRAVNPEVEEQVRYERDELDGELERLLGQQL